ncbi:MAG: glutamate--tRNA ligase [Candidatus Micrarchaeota archaeon]|nr:glutamate--tRNA ligase [Candidatus Micrarchaeota archaeon]
MDIREIALKWALKNAFDYGKADVGAVVGKVIAEYPDIKKDMKSAMQIINSVIQFVNSMPREEIEQHISKYSFGEKKKEEKKGVNLPPHIEGKVVTRFAPEPSGYLHIGHAKACLISWQGAREQNGKFILRIDDTNPSLAKQEFVNALKEDLKWLGVDWDVECFTSDFMDMFYKYAFDLIKMDKAYVCECNGDTIKINREERRECPCRNKPIIKNIKDLEKMINGGFNEGEAVLRYKGSMSALNTVMRDPTLIRIVNEPHFRQEDKYVAWPSYDFVTPILDSIQGVTHAVRSKEYELRDELYYSLIKDFGLRQPLIISISRLVIKNNTTQKRVIRKLVQEGVISGWDDPRLLTMKAIRRRGIRPEALREFALSFGVSKSESKDATLEQLLHKNKQILDPVSKRLHFVSQPAIVWIKGFKSQTNLPFHQEKDLGARQLFVNEKIYLEKSDIVIGEEIRLKDLCNIKIISKISEGEIEMYEAIKTESDRIPEKKIQWVPVDSAVKVRVEKPLDLLDGEVPAKVSMQIDEGFAESYVKELQKGEVVQFIRYGYVIKDREENMPVFIFTS